MNTIAKSGMKRGTSPLILQKFKMIIREYHEQLYTNKSGDLGKMNKYPERYKLQKLIQEKTNLNRSITSKETELEI